MTNSTHVVVTGEIKPVWQITFNGNQYELKPLESITPFELYKISEWKEWARHNPHLENKSDKAAMKARELGILRHFQISAPLQKVGTNENREDAL